MKRDDDPIEDLDTEDIDEVGAVDDELMTDEERELLWLDGDEMLGEFDEVDRDDDPIQVVCPGDAGGWAQLVNLSLGLGDSVIYSADAVAEVCERQRDAELPEDGIVSGSTWSLVLPDLFSADRPIGREVGILRVLHGMDVVGGWTSEVTEELIEHGYEGHTVDREVWEFLILNALVDA